MFSGILKFLYKLERFLYMECIEKIKYDFLYKYIGNFCDLFVLKKEGYIIVLYILYF